MWLRIKTDIDPSGRMCRLHPARYIKEDDVMPLALSQSSLDVGSSPSFCAGRKLGDLEQALLWSLLQEDPQCPSRLLFDTHSIAFSGRPMGLRCGEQRTP